MLRGRWRKRRWRDRTHRTSMWANRWSVGILLVTLAIQISPAAQKNRADGIFSRSAISIWGRPAPFTIPAPVGQKSIVVGKPSSAEEYVRVSVRVGEGEFPTDIGSWVNSEVSWALDSSAFFVTYSDAGNIGTYHVK